MYSTHYQQQPEAFASRKRARGDDDDDDDDMAQGSMGFSEHRNKRFQAMSQRAPGPMLTNPTPFAPANHMGAAPEQHPFSTWPGQQGPFSAQADGGMDMDMGMDSAPTLGVPQTFDRVPTPMYPTFAAQVRSANWGAGPGPALNHMEESIQHQQQQQQQQQQSILRQQPHLQVTMPRGLGLVMEDDNMMEDAVPRGMHADTEWHNVQNRKLPSPISETDGGSPGMGGLGSPDMVLDAGFGHPRPSWAVGGGMQRTDGTWAAGSPDSSSGLHHLVHQNTWHAGTSSQRVDNPSSPLSNDGQSSPQSPSPGRKGHSRSRHTLGSPVAPTGLTKTFSIGYRADCEKCRNKVPGHFNHFVLTSQGVTQGLM